MTGYQETLTDPSYHRQIVVPTAPHIGNTGLNDEDDESRAHLGRGLRRARPGAPAVQLALTARAGRGARAPGDRRGRGIDTRALTRHLRELGRDALRASPATGGTEPSCSTRSAAAPRWPAPTCRRGDDAGALHRRRRGSAALHGRRARPRDQGDDPAHARRPRHRDPGAAEHRDGRGAARRLARRGVPLQRPRATRPPPTTPSRSPPRCCAARCRCSASASATRSSAAPWASAPTSSRTATAASTCPSSTTRRARSPSRARTTASRSTRRSTAASDDRLPARRGHVARVSQRRGRRGAACADRASLLRAVPPRGGGRPARRRLPVRPLRRPDGGR